MSNIGQIRRITYYYHKMIDVYINPYQYTASLKNDHKGYNEMLQSSFLTLKFSILRVNAVYTFKKNSFIITEINCITTFL